MFSVISIVSKFLCLIFFIRKAELAPTFTVTPPNPFYVLEGDNITFVWQYNFDGKFDRVIFRLASSTPSRNIVVKHDLNLNASVPKSFYKGRVRENINATRAEITIFTLQRSESGKYEIEVIDNNFDPAIDGTTVQVQYPPEFNIVSSDVVVVEGDPSITLECIADGEPTPGITWTRVDANGSDSGVLVTGNQFVLENNRDNSGTYRCTAHNGIGTAPNRTVKVEVNFKPENVKLMVKDSVVCKGDVITITCAAGGKPVVHTYQLFENEIPVNDGNSSAGVWIRKYLKGEDLSYSCVANNTVGTTEKTLNFTVKVPSKVYPLENITVIQGENRTLTCNVSGSPVLAVTWTEISSRSQSFGVMRYLTNISRYNAGEYKCEATNDCGNSSASTFLTVLLPPSIPALQDQSATEGDNVTLLCPVSGIPPPVVSWMTPNGQRHSGYMLELTSINRSQAGEYKCEASNECGNATRTASINVQFKLPDSVTVPGPVPSEPAKVNKDAIYGSVIGVLAFMFAVSIFFIAWKRRKPEKDDRLDPVLQKSRRPFNAGIELENFNGNPSTVVHHGPGHYMDLSEVGSLNEPATDPARSYLEINEYAPLHPGTRSWEVERENVTIEKVIGKGAFGQVAQGKVSNLRGREETITVAIKMLKGNATDTERKDLLSELEVMKKLKPHPHVIRLLGCVTESDPLLVLIEYVPYGDLLGYLRKSRQLEDNYFKDPDIKPQTSLTSQQLMKFSWQVADGMQYLSSKNIIHRDLAARNVLVGERERCKVTDFGMARDVCQENIYERKSKGRLPVKWTACEALLYGRYTTKSDVWSFGIVLYEIFTIGGSPYPKIHGRKLADLLTQGYRMPKPRHVDDTLYKIMQACWQENPDDRPMFENLRNDLKEMEDQHQRLINMKHYDNILYAGMD